MRAASFSVTVQRSGRLESSGGEPAGHGRHHRSGTGRRRPALFRQNVEEPRNRLLPAEGRRSALRDRALQGRDGGSHRGAVAARPSSPSPPRGGGVLPQANSPRADPPRGGGDVDDRAVARTDRPMFSRRTGGSRDPNLL